MKFFLKLWWTSTKLKINSGRQGEFFFFFSKSMGSSMVDVKAVGDWGSGNSMLAVRDDDDDDDFLNFNILNKMNNATYEPRFSSPNDEGKVEQTSVG